jgi:hypothetical protein
MDSFYGSWRDGIKGKAKKLERLKSFTKFCLNRDGLAKDITSDLKAPAGSFEINSKSPFEDEELQRIFDACDENPAPDNYRDYLRLKLRQAAKTMPADGRKHTLFDDR